MRNDDTDTSADRQQISNKIFRDKNHATRNMECLRLCLTIQVPYLARSRLSKHSSGLPLSNGIDPQRKISIETTRHLTNVANTSQSPIDRRPDDEQLLFLQDKEEEAEQKIFARKAIDEHEKELSTKITESIKTPPISAVYTFGATKENARIGNEQDADPLLKALKLRILHEEYDKHLLKTEPRRRNWLRHEERIIMKDGVLMRKYYGEDGTVAHHQAIHLVPELLFTLHSKTNNYLEYDTGM